MCVLRELYEFLNPSDGITFYAMSDEIARTATLLLGNGKAGAKAIDSDNNLEYCFTAFNPAPEEIYKTVEKHVKTPDKDLIDCLNSFAVCKPYEREIYDDYTNNGTNETKFKKWDDKNRSSMNDFCGYARRLAASLNKKLEANV